ncbi:MAG: F0F1 ATP synthase subunit A [Chitinophagaceae bacterium]|nr:F0F1 ATP synthase subunit A [Chitinophagaceae bacterium]
MNFYSVRSLLVAVFSVIMLSFSANVSAQEHEGVPHEGLHDATKSGHDQTEDPGKFNPGELIMDHISDSHDFHFFDWKGHPVSIPLPVILYAPQRGLSVFSSSKFEHGHKAHEGYQIEKNNIAAVDENGNRDASVKVYDFSITKNVVQMILSLIILVWIMTSIAAKYKKQGSAKAPSGLQNAVEPVVTFIRDEVGKANLGRKYEKYMPFLLTIFFFILINNLFGLLPGSANVTGNIAFTAVLGIISFIVILFSTNRHFWGHIFNPPVPGFVKLILIPVEFLGIFTKPFALIIRLFANMVAGHIVITCFVMLIFIFGGMAKAAGWGFSPVSVLFTVFIYLIEILVAFIQAFIFTNLTAVFIGQSFEGSHDDVDHHDDGVIV